MRPGPPPLAELQSWLRWVFTNPGGPRAALGAAEARDGLPRRPEPRPRLLPWIAGSGKIPVERRLAVYSDAYFLRLHEALACDFPTVRRALGDDRFLRFCADYLARHPSRRPNISEVGSGLPEFAAGHAFSRRFPFLPDLARLEWAVLSSLFLHRLPTFDPSQLSRLSPRQWERAALVFDPTVQLLETEWPVDRLWRSRRLRALKTPKKRGLLVHRDEHWVRVRPLEGHQWAALKSLAAGLALGQVCDVCAARGAQAADFEEWFSDWTSWGILKGVNIFVTAPRV